MWRFLWISIFCINGAFHFSDAVNVRCFRGSRTNYEVASVDNMEVFMTTGCVNTSLTTVIFSHGFKSNPDTIDTVLILDALIYHPKKHNVILINWEDKAYAPNITLIDDAIFYTAIAAPATEPIGKQCGRALAKMATYYELDLRNTILMGFSLGSAMMGYAGRELTSKNMSAGLFYGIDNPNPLYSSQFPLFTPPNKESAAYVVCFHFDPGYYGINESLCGVDVWANYRNYIDGNHLQPDCPSRFIMRGCSHVRAPAVTADALNNPGTVLASGASNYWDWAAQNGAGTDVIDMGDFDNVMHAHVNYYLTTNGAKPFGRMSDGLRPDS